MAREREDNEKETCMACGGRGYVYVSADDPDDDDVEETCRCCGGSGEV